MNGFWTIQQVFAFTVTAAAAIAIAWRIVNKIFRQSTATHAKIDAIETLLEQLSKTGMTLGAAEALARLERRLLITQAQVRLVMEIDGTGYVETNKDGGLIYCNTQFTSWTGMTIESAKGLGWVNAIHPDDRDRVLREWESAVKDHRSVELWFRYKYRSIETPVHARTITVLDDELNEVLGFVAVIVPDN